MDTHFVDTCTIAVGPATGTVFPINCNNVNINAKFQILWFLGRIHINRLINLLL